MILDSADDEEVFYPKRDDSRRRSNLYQTRSQSPLPDAQRPLASFLPNSSNGKIIITSRTIDVAEKITGSYKYIFTVPAMNQIQALQLLQKKLHKCDKDGMEDLLQDLGYIPLAITQAAAYINRRAPSMSVSAYLDQFRKSDKKKEILLGKEVCDLRRDVGASNSIITTWQVTFEQIRKDRPSAADLLSIMSFFNPQGIPKSALLRFRRDTAEETDKQTNHQWGSMLWLVDNVRSILRGKDPSTGEEEEIDEIESDLDDDLDVLRGYSLVTIMSEKEVYEMHPLVQFCTRIWLSQFDIIERWRRKFLHVISKEFPSGVFENWPTCQKLLPHTESILKEVPSKEGLEDWTDLVTNVAWYMWKKGSYKTAEEMSRKAVDLMGKIRGQEAPATLTSITVLAETLQDQFKFEEAEQNYRCAIKGREKVLGRQHPDTLAAVHGLAGLLKRRDELAEAEQMYRRALEGREEVLGVEHLETLASVHGLAGVLRRTGRYEEAEQMYQRALEGREKKLGGEHPMTLLTISSLARLFHKQKQCKQAAELYVRAYKGFAKVLGLNHPTTKQCKDNYSALKEIDDTDHGNHTILI